MYPNEEFAIHVKEVDIQRGRRSTPTRCPVALAVNRELGWSRRVVGYRAWVNASSVSIVRNGVRVAVYDMPRWAADRVQAFDETGKMEPFVFHARRLNYAG